MGTTAEIAGAADIYGVRALPVKPHAGWRNRGSGYWIRCMPESTATLDDALQTDRSRLHRGVLLRRAGTAALFLLVLAALLGWFGLRSTTKSASQGALTTKLH